MRTHRPVRERLDGPAHGEIKHAVPREAGEGADQEDCPRGELVAEVAGEEADVLANVVGDAEHGELVLAEPEDRLEGVGVEGEVEAVAGAYLEPHGGTKAHPRRPRPSLQIRHGRDKQCFFFHPVGRDRSSSSCKARERGEERFSVHN